MSPYILPRKSKRLKRIRESINQLNELEEEPEIESRRVTHKRQNISKLESHSRLTRIKSFDKDKSDSEEEEPKEEILKELYEKNGDKHVNSLIQTRRRRAYDQKFK